MSLIESYADGTVLIIQYANARILDETTIGNVDREVNAAIDKTEDPNVVLDFSKVAFMSSSMLGRLVKLNKKCKEYKVNLALCGISKDIMEVFKMTKLNKLFNIQPDIPSARQSLLKR
ncbi:MAG: STAS domain-containing protein [Pirellulales bacterium]